VNVPLETSLSKFSSTNVRVVLTKNVIILIHHVSGLQILFGDVYSANFVVNKWYFDSVYFVCSNSRAAVT